MSEWKKVKLGDLATKITKGTTPSNIGESFCDRGIPFIRSELITQNKYISDVGLLYISKETHEKLKRSQLEANDILFSMAGVYLGKTAILRECDVPANTNQAVALIRLDSVLCNVDYIYYYLNQESVIRYVNQISGQAAQPNINLQQIGEISIVIPSRKEQDNIATILSRYDSLIENYQKQIKLLEEAAQRLYKEWFVDLRFPGYENAKMVDGLPEGWERKKLGEVVTKSIGGGWGKEAPQEKYDREGFVIRGTDISKLKNGSLNEIPFRYHTESNLKERTLSDGDIIFEVSGGSEKEPVGRMYLITQPILDYYCKDVICASFCKKVSFANKMISVLCYFAMQHCRNTGDMKKFEKDSAGNIINFAWTTFLEDFNVLLPNNEVLNAFYRRANAIINSEMKLSLQIRLLAEARDRLLPKLMGGEMEVDAPKGQRATSIEQRSGHNEQTTNAPKGQKH